MSILTHALGSDVAGLGILTPHDCHSIIMATEPCAIVKSLPAAYIYCWSCYCIAQKSYLYRACGDRNVRDAYNVPGT